MLATGDEARFGLVSYKLKLITQINFEFFRLKKKRTKSCTSVNVPVEILDRNTFLEIAKLISEFILEFVVLVPLLERAVGEVLALRITG